MSTSPIANRSFLHGERKVLSVSQKILYATLDSLALKRARLPLQLLPVDGSNVGRKVSGSDVGTNASEVSTGRSNMKVKARSLPSKRDSKSPLISPSNAEIEHSENSNADGKSGDNASQLYATATDTLQYFERDKDSQFSKILAENEFCRSDNRSESEASSDYERIEVPESLVTIDGEMDSKDTTYPRRMCVKSMSTSDLITESSPDLGRENRTSLMETLGENQERVSSKKKRHFARHVLHFVPGHLVKRPKKLKKKKKKQKTGGHLSSSMSSLKTSPAYPDIAESSAKSRSLSREELKSVKISSPTNFVHVASATNPDLVSNENTMRSSLEQVVITHEQKCARLPLLIGESEYFDAENENDRRSRAIARMHSLDAWISNGMIEEMTRKRNAINEAILKRAAAAQSAKVLEQSQKVKTNGNRGNAEERETYQASCDPTPSSSIVELRANSSFLWSNQAKCLLEGKRQETETLVEESVGDAEEYDDVGPINFIVQDDDYDDVGSPTSPDESRIILPFEDSYEIYDDVVAPDRGDRKPTIISENDDYPTPTSNEPSSTDASGNSTATGTRDYPSDDEEDHYLSITNEYSSVDDEDPNASEDDEQGVYDDVGLPSVERVNSLYGGSAASSILGLGQTSTNGKESEWEDLDDLTGSLSRRKSNPWKDSGAQVVPSKEKPVQRRSKKVKRQRSRASKKSCKSCAKTTRDSTIYVAVSLGRGSVLLVGYSEKIEGCGEGGSSDPIATKGPQRNLGLVQLRVIDLDEDVDTQETSCYVHEDNASDDSAYEDLYSFQLDDFSSDSEGETTEANPRPENAEANVQPHNNMEAPTRPNPPPPREASLTQTLGRRIKMLRRTWSITKGSLGRMRRRTPVEDDHSCEENRDSCNDHQTPDVAGRYFGFTRHFRKSITGLSTFYLDGSPAADRNDSRNSNRSSGKEPIYSNTNWFTRPISPVGSNGDSSTRLQKDVARDQYSVLADQEPLYQFYAAAAARVAFDSDSDGYEEVEGRTPSQATTDLAKPGHRTLWCQTPQVINSGLLQRLCPEEKKIQEAKFEVLTSEASYLNSLRVLDNEFLNDPVLINEILTPIERDKLFGAIPSILAASEMFLAELETVWRQDLMLRGLADLLLKYADKCLDIYVAYCSNQVSIDTTLKELRAGKGSKFLEAVSQIESRPICQSLSLHSFLMLPMQRVTRLPLLADAVLSKLSMEHDDRSQWERVLSSLSYVVAECNEGARTAAKEAEMEVLARKLEYNPKIKPVVLKGRHLVRSGPVVQLLTKADSEYKLTFGKKFNKTPLYLLLLTDYLLVAKLKSNTNDETYSVIDTCRRSLIALESVPEDSPFAGRNAMLLTLLENHCGRQVEYILTCDSNTERQRWLEAVSPSKRGLVGETLYEAWDCPQVVALYSYSPNQPDELSLQPGDVINVLRKMMDGWYHGEKLLDGEQGWFPGNYTKEVASEHVRARNLKQRHRLLALNGSVLQRRTKQQSAIY